INPEFKIQDGCSNQLISTGYPSDEDCFFDLLSKFQSSRMDDQRCHLDDGANGQDEDSPSRDSALNDMLGHSQSRRLDDQRVNVGNLPGLRITHNNLGTLCSDPDPQEPSDDFFNIRNANSQPF
uniref:Uncharacterized protein n=1 Tax=Astyanax mexicanus TaxID=7994 RepID=A0A3B1JLH9_ASTMX